MSEKYDSNFCIYWAYKRNKEAYKIIYNGGRHKPDLCQAPPISICESIRVHIWNSSKAKMVRQAPSPYPKQIVQSLRWVILCVFHREQKHHNKQKSNISRVQNKERWPPHPPNHPRVATNPRSTHPHPARGGKNAGSRETSKYDRAHGWRLPLQHSPINLRTWNGDKITFCVAQTGQTHLRPPPAGQKQRPCGKIPRIKQQGTHEENVLCASKWGCRLRTKGSVGPYHLSLP